MKILKIIFLVIIALCMATLLIVIQVQNAIHSTVLSEKFFNKMYDMSDIDKLVDDAVISAANDLSEEISGVVSSDNIKNKLDTEEVAEIAEEVAKGTYAYFMGAQNKLPDVRIKPLKDMILEVVFAQVEEYTSEFTERFDLILQGYEQIATTEGSEVDYDAISEVSKQLGASTDDVQMVTFVVETAADLDPDLSAEDKINKIAQEFMKDSLNVDEIEDELDLDEFISDVYGDDNPAEAIRDMLSLVKQKLFNMLLICLILYAAIIVLTAFKPAKIFAWLSAPMLFGGLFGFGTGLIGMITPAYTRYMYSMSPDVSENVSEQLFDFYQNLSSGISVYFFTQGAITLGIGIIFLILAIVLSKVAKRNGTTEVKKNVALTIIRVVLVVGLLIAIVAVSAGYALTSSEVMLESMDKLERSSQNVDSDDITSKLYEAINFPEIPTLE